MDTIYRYLMILPISIIINNLPITSSLCPWPLPIYWCTSIPPSLVPLHKFSHIFSLPLHPSSLPYSPPTADIAISICNRLTCLGSWPANEAAITYTNSIYYLRMVLGDVLFLINEPNCRCLNFNYARNNDIWNTSCTIHSTSKVTIYKTTYRRCHKKTSYVSN